MLTKNFFITYWMSNRDWWEYDSAGTPVLLPTAPPKAKDSYKQYLEHEEKLKKMSEEPVIIDE